MTTALRPDLMGPVDVAVIGLEGEGFSGDVAPALAELQSSGTVRIIDLSLVRRDRDGSPSFVEVEEAGAAPAFSGLHAETFDLLSDDDLLGIANDLEPGRSALVVVWENSWATRFATAVRSAHGEMLLHLRIPRENVVRAIEALDEKR